MGKTIEAIALKKGFQITARIQEDNWHELDGKSVDVAIEFSQPEAAYDNIMKCLKMGIPTISGTTGWLEHKDTVESYCRTNGGTFFYASNFSIGVNIFFQINEMVAKMMDRFPDYSVHMEEVHHIHKKDSPSGTGITLAEGIAANHGAIQSWVETDDVKKADPNQLPILSSREGEVPGTHSLHYESEVDSIMIEHKAHSREGFAQGAVLVAEWIVDKKGVLSMKDFMK